MSSILPAWPLPDSPPTLNAEEIHVWRVSLSVPEAHWASLWGYLSEDERQRAARFYFTKDRERFVARRGALRAILTAYLSIAPDRLRFRYNSHGKPVLQEASGGGGLYFNLAHSGELALVAVANGRELGVDLERIRPEVECLPIARRFFSPREVQSLMSLPPEAQMAAFYRGWTRKEAYIKARGKGLSLPLDQFDVSLAPGETATLLATRPDPMEAARWSLRELDVAAGYAAALAMEGSGWALKRWQWMSSN